ncbi:MAG: hypothetical protein CR988_05375 [Treponema sp.]|nr:MAG: hypothetical protein CR988_05375 [Treponema sp.]
MPSKFDKNKKNSDAFVFTTDFDKQMFSNLNIEPSKSYLKLGSTITKQKFNDIPKKILQNKSGLIEFIYLFNNCYIYSVVFVK